MRRLHLKLEEKPRETDDVNFVYSVFLGGGSSMQLRSQLSEEIDGTE